MKARVTKRTQRARLWYFDDRGMRFVVYRTAAGVTRKTSIRVSQATMQAGLSEARRLAKLLHSCPAERLAQFSFAEGR